RAHCIEGAFVAACALWVHGDPPLVMYMDCDSSDYPHVIALFRRTAAWGAISKHNGPQLRYRDPIYRSLRELAMSYFHEYFDWRGSATTRSFLADRSGCSLAATASSARYRRWSSTRSPWCPRL